MVSLPPAWTRHLSRTASVVLVLLCLIVTACSTADRNAKILFEDPRGTVSLQSMPDQSIQATHPITLEPILIAQILRGMEVQDQERGLQKLLDRTAASCSRLLGRSDSVSRSLACRGFTDGGAGSAYWLSCRDDTQRFLPRIFDHGNHLWFPLCLWPTAVCDPLSISIFTDAYESELWATWPIDRVPLITSGLQNRILLFTPSDCPTIRCLRSAGKGKADR